MRQDQRHLLPAQIVLGHYYSSTEHGDGWSVRQIVDESHSPDPQKDMVVYKVIAGAESSTSGVLTRTEFARWASTQFPDVQLVRRCKGHFRKTS